MSNNKLIYKNDIKRFQLNPIILEDYQSSASPLIARCIFNQGTKKKEFVDESFQEKEEDDEEKF